MFWMSMHKHQTHDIFGDKLNQPWVFEIQIQAKRLPASIYLFQFIYGNTRTMCEICSKLSIKTSEQLIFPCRFFLTPTRAKTMIFLGDRYHFIKETKTLLSMAGCNTYVREVSGFWSEYNNINPQKSSKI